MTEREPICGFCWADRRRIPLEYHLGAGMYYCPRCGRMVLEGDCAPAVEPEPEVSITAADVQARIDATGSPRMWGGPPIPRKRGGGSRSGRRRKREKPRRRYAPLT